MRLNERKFNEVSVTSIPLCFMKKVKLSRCNIQTSVYRSNLLRCTFKLVDIFLYIGLCLIYNYLQFEVD